MVAVGKITQLKFCEPANASSRNLVAGGRIVLPTRGFSTLEKHHLIIVLGLPLLV